MSKGPSGAQKGLKQIKLVYKQMRESSEKGKGQQVFQSMEDQMSQWVVNDGLQFSVVSVKGEEMTGVRSNAADDACIYPKTDRVYEF